MSAQTEAQKYGAFARRILRAMGRRVADRDIEALSVLAELQADLAEQMQASVDALLASGEYSWTDIGRQLGMSRQGAQQKYGKRRPTLGQEAEIAAGINRVLAARQDEAVD
jgi:hypothetical protein